MGQLLGTEDVKCVMIGESGVGKTTLVNLWRLEPLPQAYCPSSGIVQHDVHFKVVICSTPAKCRGVRLVVYDVGSDVTESALETCIKNADVIIMVYDVTKDYTLDYLDYVWPKLLVLAKGSALFVLVGIKNDNSVTRRRSTGAMKLIPRKLTFDVGYANITSFAVEQSANVRSLCYQILRRAYAQRHKDIKYSYDFLFNANKNERDQNSRGQQQESDSIKTFRNKRFD